MEDTDHNFYCEEVIDTCIEFESEDHAYCRCETDCEEPVADSSGLGTGLHGPATMQSRLDEFVVKSNFKGDMQRYITKFLKSSFLLLTVI